MVLLHQIRAQLGVVAAQVELSPYGPAVCFDGFYRYIEEVSNNLAGMPRLHKLAHLEFRDG
jgi:hypothetical protein